MANNLQGKINRNHNELEPDASIGKVVWLFGLSGSGKSTIADKLEELLRVETSSVYRLDGDLLRTGLNSDLGFSEQDRMENIRRTAEVAKLFADAGFIVIASLITPLQSMRELAGKIIGMDKFMSIYVKTSLEVCEKRDPKGLYKKARNGEISSFTGIDSPFEVPAGADLVIDTEKYDVEKSAVMVIEHMK